MEDNKIKKSVGVFVLTWRRVRDDIYSLEDKNIYLAINELFKNHHMIVSR